MNTSSQSSAGLGIRLTGDQPFSVVTQQSWKGNGETARHLPVEAWGTSYYSMNFYQDRFGTSMDRKHRPSQILIVAAYDGTEVTYTPTVDTEGGIIASVGKGTSVTVRLNRAETYLILSKIDTALYRDNTTDLSGTLITSNLPPTGSFASAAHFVRNNVHDVMYPNSLAGTSFITLPCRYTTTRVVGQGSVEYGIEDDRGDVVRIIGLEDGTIVKTKRQDGSALLTKFNLNKGVTRYEPALEVATYWVSKLTREPKVTQRLKQACLCCKWYLHLCLLMEWTTSSALCSKQPISIRFHLMAEPSFKLLARPFGSLVEQSTVTFER